MNLEEVGEIIHNNINGPLDWAIVLIGVGYIVWLAWFIRNDR